MKKILIIGSGAAGLAAGRFLVGQGHDVTLFDKGFRLGGRLATRNIDGFRFDHATALLSRDELTDDLPDADFATWPSDLPLDLPSSKPEAVNTGVGVPAMRSLAEAWGAGLTIRQGVTVEKISQTPDGYIVDISADIKPSAEQAKPYCGPYDGVIVTAPAPQAAVLLADIPELAALVELAEKAVYDPQWALLVGYDIAPENNALENLPPCYVSPHPDISLITHETAKPGRSGKTAFVVHAGADWSRAHLDLSKPEAAARLLPLFQEITGNLPALSSPSYLAGHLWRYSRVQQIAGAAEKDVLAAHQAIAIAGDWVISPDVKGARTSGRLAAENLHRYLIKEA